MKPFEHKEAPRGNLLLRLVGRKPRSTALVEINNLLASADSIRSLRTTQIQAVTERHRVNVTARFARQLLDMYRAYLEHCLIDKRLSEDEVLELNHLKMLFDLSDRETRNIHEKLAGQVYGEDVASAIADARLSDEERDFLDKLRGELQLSNEIANAIFAKVAQAQVQAYLDNAIVDERLSPNEEEELRAISASLRTNITLDKETRATLDRFRAYWAIENADLPVIEADINLPRGEKCYAMRGVGWYEPRTETQRIRYAGPTARIRIAKGIYFRAGDIAFQPVRKEVLKHIDTGTVYLTNKRLIFVGDKKNTNIRLNRILDYKCFSNGLEVIKDAGRNPFIEIDQDIDLFVLIFARALRGVE